MIITTADLIDAFLRQRGKSRRQLAIEAGIPPSTLQSALERKRTFSVEMLQKIAAALECDVKDLIPPARAAEQGALAEGLENMRRWQELAVQGYTFSERENDLICAFSQMNADGQLCAVHLVQDLAQVPKYKKPSGGGPRAVDPQEND